MYIQYNASTYIKNLQGVDHNMIGWDEGVAKRGVYDAKHPSDFTAPLDCSPHLITLTNHLVVQLHGMEEI